jgi:hypothetical protein
LITPFAEDAVVITFTTSACNNGFEHTKGSDYMSDVSKILEDGNGSVSFAQPGTRFRQLYINEAVDRESEDHDTSLLKAWAVSRALSDAEFIKAISTEHLLVVEDGINSGFRLEAINYAFYEVGTPLLEEFVVGSFYINVCPECLEDEMDEFPAGFVRDLCT